MNPPSPPQALDAENLTHVFRPGIGRRPVTALSKVSLSVPPGEVFGLIGPNGSGKSTLVRLAAGLLKPTEGRLSLFGDPAGSLKARRRQGYLPENLSLPRHLSGREVLDHLGALSELPRAVRKPRIETWLETFDLAPDADRWVREYSKGMTAKIGIIQALLHEPDFVLFDEPTSGLDPRAQRTFYNVVGDLRRRGATVFLSSHLLSTLETVCTRIGILHKGKLLRTGTVEEIAGIRRSFSVRLRRDEEMPEEDVRAALVEAGFHVDSLTPAVRPLLEVFDEMAAETPGDEDSAHRENDRH